MNLPARLPVLLAAATIVVLAGCAEPDLPEGDAADDAASETEAEVLDPARDALLEEVAGLRRTVAAAADALLTAVEVDDDAAARNAGRVAVANLVDDPSLSPGADATERPLFPARTDERGATGDDGDVFTAVTTAARSASGPLANAVTDLLRDPVAGDVGAWSRDPAGMVGLVRSATTSSGALDDLEQAVLDLPGEGTRALAWSLLVSDAADLDDAAAYADRGLAHLGLIIDAIDAIESGA